MVHGLTLEEVRAPDVARAWFDAVTMVLAAGGEAFHTVVRIGSEPDNLEARGAVDQLLRSQLLQPVETVANTVFPAALAGLAPEPGDLAARYQRLYPRLKAYQRNRYGTYFGRLVAYPDAGPNSNQLAHVVEKVRWELEHRRRTSRYECAIYHPTTDARRPQGFPCLSQCAFHLDIAHDCLHLSAIYRNQHLIERGYGNYLGLARLRDYIAAAVRLQPGELMVVAGHARVDGRRKPLRSLLNELGRGGA